MQADSSSSPTQMRTFLTLASDPNATKEALIQVLHEFNAVNLSQHKFAERYGEQTKQDFLGVLTEKLRSAQWSDQERTTALFSARLCLREGTATHIFGEPEVLVPILQLAKLSEARAATTNIEEEALKLVANAGLHYKETLRSVLKENGSLKTLVAKLQALNRSSGLLFPLMRLIFYLVSDDTDAAVAAEALEVHLLEVVVQTLESALKHDWPTNQLVVHECLKALFLLSIHLGPLKGSQTPPTVEEVTVFHKLVPLLSDCLALPNSLSDLKASAVSCMINTPYVCTPLFDPLKTLPGLLRLLEHQLLESSDAEVLVPTLLVLTSIARDMSTARRILKKALFPIAPPPRKEGEKMGVAAPTEIETKTLGGRIIQHMTAMNPGLSYYANEFIFQLCSENADEFVALTGFGNAAGLLQRRGLFGFGQGLTKEGPIGVPVKPKATEDFLKAAMAQEQQLQKLEQLLEAGTVQMVSLKLDSPPAAPENEKK